MKKMTLLLALLMSCTLAKAQEKIILSCSGIRDGAIGHQPIKSPVIPPAVYLDNHTLTFSPTHPEYILYIKDEEDTVVYSTVVSESETTVVLPAALSGDYEIDLVMGNWMFTGWIEL